MVVHGMYIHAKMLLLVATWRFCSGRAVPTVVNGMKQHTMFITARSTCSGATQGGHLEVLQEWARANGFPWLGQTCSSAAQGGHLEVLQWVVRANGCPWNEWTWLLQCSSKWPLEKVLQGASANGCPWDEWTCKNAFQSSHLKVLGWARANGCPEPSVMLLL